MSAAALLVGAWLNWQEFTQLGVVGLGLLLVAVVSVLLPGVPGAELVLAPTRVSQGRPASVELVVRNGYLPLLGPLLHVPVRRSVGAPDDGGGSSLRLPPLAPLAGHREDFELPRLPRGVWQVGPITYVKGDVLGLLRRPVLVSGTATLLVRPRVVPLELLAGGGASDLEGAASDRLTMSDLAFHALREYHPGDDLRHVHWRSSAKADQLLVRQYHESHRGQVTVLADGARSSYASLADFELAVSVAASVALRAVSDGLHLHVSCGGFADTPTTAEQVLDAASRFTCTDGQGGRGAADASARPELGLMVQVSGAERASGAVRGFEQRRGSDVKQMLVLVDLAGAPGTASVDGVPAVTISDLAQLPGLMQSSLR